MKDSTLNGAQVPVNPLGAAIERHARTLLELNTLPNRMIQVNASQMMCELELTMVRIEVLFEALAELGIVQAKDLAEKLRNKLNAESDQMQDQINTPQLAIALGSIPRNG